MEKQEEEEEEEDRQLETSEPAISHFCHPHDLIILRHLNNNVLCAACADPISLSGPAAYTCAAGCRFHIHSSCLSHMPHQVEHLFHWTHHLLPEHLPDDETARCDACLGQIKGVVFRCEQSFCKFDLHASCTNHPRRGLKHSCHYHHLYYYPQKRVIREDCFCEVCGEDINGDFYRCVWADVNFHLHCIPLQASLKHHEHQLTLVGSQTSVNCHVCGAECDVNHSAYFCEQCSDFVAHIECVASEEKIEHFSHEHGLSYIEVMSEDGDSRVKLCECCLFVVQGTAYACLTCNFWLHQNCFHLPLNKDHNDLHPNHSLRLVTGFDYKMSETFICDLCTDLYAGFRYCCRDCGFTLDLACASEKLEKHSHGDGERSTIHHFTHEHPLTLSSCEKLKDRVAGQEMLQKLRCKRCLQVISGYVHCCCYCKFFLHESCTEVPDKMDHPLHPQHMLFARDSEDERCNACEVCFSGITYKCERCHFNLDVQCASNISSMPSSL